MYIVHNIEKSYDREFGSKSELLNWMDSQIRSRPLFLIENGEKLHYDTIKNYFSKMKHSLKDKIYSPSESDFYLSHWKPLDSFIVYHNGMIVNSWDLMYDFIRFSPYDPSGRPKGCTWRDPVHRAWMAKREILRAQSHPNWLGYRKGPVPNISKIGSNYGWHKYKGKHNTTPLSEWSKNEIDKQEIAEFKNSYGVSIKIRAKRYSLTKGNAKDWDYPYCDYPGKCWKRTRKKKQWM